MGPTTTRAKAISCAIATYYEGELKPSERARCTIGIPIGHDGGQVAVKLDVGPHPGLVEWPVGDSIKFSPHLKLSLLSRPREMPQLQRSTTMMKLAREW